MHTPGPWMLRSEMLVGDPQKREDGITTEYTSLAVMTAANKEDRALIAAAPDLLGALQEFMAVADQFWGKDSRNEQAWEKAQAAILKATVVF